MTGNKEEEKLINDIGSIKAELEDVETYLKVSRDHFDRSLAIRLDEMFALLRQDYKVIKYRLHNVQRQLKKLEKQLGE